jgi:hypothetical protein
MSCSLFVKNATEELVGEIRLTGMNLLIDRIVVTDYTRNEELLRSLQPRIRISCGENRKDKFSGFTKYLQDRKKVKPLMISDYFFTPTRRG